MTDFDDPVRRWRHDMMNQLGIIDGLIKILTNEAAPDDPRLEDYVTIQNAVKRAVELAHDRPAVPAGE